MNEEEKTIREIKEYIATIKEIVKDKALKYKNVSLYLILQGKSPQGFSQPSISRLLNDPISQEKGGLGLRARSGRLKGIYNAVKEMPYNWTPEEAIKIQEPIHKRLKLFHNTNWFMYHIAEDDEGGQHFARAIMTIGGDSESVYIKSNQNEYYGKIRLLSENDYKNYINFLMYRDEDTRESGLNIIGFIGRGRIPSLILGTYQSVTHANKLIAGRLIFIEKPKVKNSDIMYFTKENIKGLNEVEPEIQQYFEIYKDNLEITVPTSVVALHLLREHIDKFKG